jgi:hypothetical protein
MLESKIYSSYASASNESLAQLFMSLFQEQARTWPRLHDGVGALQSIETRTLHCDGYDVQLQYNPKRMQSTSANVDAASIQERKCFLCSENLPTEQQGILYRDAFLLLCNPAPIFQQHGTIASIHHIPQTIEDAIEILLDLAKDLSAAFTVFYNGPKCGASAPDHLHFQISPIGSIPIEGESRDAHRIGLIKKLHDVTILMMKNYGRGVFVLESRRRDALQEMFKRFLLILNGGLTLPEEPPVNVLCSYTDSCWRLIIIPRTKHRPDVYFKEGDARIMISPASVDIGGLVITPIEKDFLTVSAEMIQDIYAEVTYGQTEIKRMVDEL